MAQNGEAAASKEGQPFHEVGVALLEAEPAAPSVSDAAQRVRERERGVNFRDLCTAAPGIIQPGRVFRSSQVVSARELELLGVSSVLDLRQPPVSCKTDARNLQQTFRRGCLDWVRRLAGRLCSGRYQRGRQPPGPAAEPCHRCSSECCEHYGIQARVYHVDLLPTTVSLRILWELPRNIQAKVLWAAARRKHPEPIVAGAVADPEVMGYVKLYIILLERAQGRLAEALRLFATADAYPLLVHCIHGKDRTGLVAMLLLLLCGVPRQAVIQDYALSEGLLRESREKQELLGLATHLTTDQVIASAAHVMDMTIKHIEVNYGSAYNYMKQLGLTDAELARMSRNLTQPGLAMPATAATAACEQS